LSLASLLQMKLSLWSPIFRVPAFIALFAAGYWLSSHLPVLSSKSNLQGVGSAFVDIGQGNLEPVSNAEFAYALACSIVSTASGLAFAMLVLNLLAIRLSLLLAMRPLGRPKSPQEFKIAFDLVNHKLQDHALIGHAWTEFEKTCVRDVLIRRTIRPLSLINSGVARERLFGLRLMPTIPGYFVGLGLLLTFIGLVIALSKAAGGVSGSPENMTQSLRELLDAATFKFSTSIAGLFASLALAIIFKSYSILIDTGFERFSREVERRTVYLAPQAIMLQSVQAEKEQLEQLKQINDVQFFEKLGKTIAPALKSAVEEPWSRLRPSWAPRWISWNRRAGPVLRASLPSSRMRSRVALASNCGSCRTSSGRRGRRSTPCRTAYCIRARISHVG
jgi:hypothetical protein